MRLSVRDKQVLALVGTGASDKKVGAALSLSCGTIKVYLNRLRLKLRAMPGLSYVDDGNSRVALAFLAIRLGLAPGVVPIVPDQPQGSVLPETTGHAVDPIEQSR